MAQMNLIVELELQLYKQVIHLIGQQYPTLSDIVQELLDSFSEKKRDTQQITSYHRPENDSYFMMYNLIGIAFWLPEVDICTISQLIRVAQRFS